MNDEIQKSFRDEMFHVRRSVKYHDNRWGFYDKILSASMFLALATGPALVALFAIESLRDMEPAWVRYLPAVFTSVFTGTALILRVNAKANLHSELRSSFIRLRKEMELGRGTMSDSDVAGWTAQRLDIETREFPINRVVDALCHNEVLQSMGVADHTKYVRVLTWHRIIGPYTRYFDKKLRLYQPGEKGPAWT